MFGFRRRKPHVDTADYRRDQAFKYWSGYQIGTAEKDALMAGVITQYSADFTDFEMQNGFLDAIEGRVCPPFSQ